ncbi:hypothetical protein ACQ7CX_18845 [Chryseobacterium arthrosphaerae]|uniref:hypothetical protein n=1 Tax=Chryseobacterium arthrosphaerae TaxID=651561 RepID=UPI001BB05166|nr:hypothetical protein [Chryseobacterium arthrosphaerae]QUY55722.1 hypothetical protein I2F65_23235 [Chryseobacterium arthrosphaerae]
MKSINTVEKGNKPHQQAKKQTAHHSDLSKEAWFKKLKESLLRTGNINHPETKEIEKDYIRTLSIDQMHRYNDLKSGAYIPPIIGEQTTKYINTNGKEPFDEFDKNGKKISNLGGNKINFHHQSNGDTQIINLQTGTSNIIKGGESIIRNYTHREKDVGWGTITGEYFGGSGPTRSLFSDFNNSNHGPFASLDKTSSPYSSLARQDALNSKKSKGFIKMDYLHANPIRANFDWNEQMWGRSIISWYKLGDKILFVMTDSKSQESLFYRLPVKNFERTEGKVNSFANTYQTYMWTESNSEVKQKVYDQFDPKIPNTDDKKWQKAAADYIKNGTP